MGRSTSTGTRLNWRIHGYLAGWRTWPAPPDTSQSSYDAEAHSSSVIAGQGESGRPSARYPKCGYGVTELRVRIRGSSALALGQYPSDERAEAGCWFFE